MSKSCALLSDSFIVLFSKLLKLWSWMKNLQPQISFPGLKSYQNCQDTDRLVLILKSSLTVACAVGGIAWLKFWRRSCDLKKGVGTRHLKYRPPENPSILNSPHTSVQGNWLVAGYTYVNHSRWSFAWSFSYFPREQHRCQGFWFVWSEKWSSRGVWGHAPPENF